MSKFADTATSPLLLLVEGAEDLEVVGALLDVNSIVPGFAIKNATGIQQLKAAFNVELKATNIRKKVWVIADADNDCNSRWQMLRNCMIETGNYDISPKTPLPAEGAIFHPKTTDGITIGIWIMPDNTHQGMLEDFIAMLVKADDTLISHARNVTEALDADRQQHPHLFRNPHLPKAIIHTWLAWQDPPGRSIGTAILKNSLELNKPLGISFMQWLGKLQN